MNATAFEASDGFVHRHIGPAPSVLSTMLKAVGANSLETLIDQVVPSHIRQVQPLQLPDSQTETQLLADLKKLAQKNKVLRNYIGQGYYGTHTPTVILRNILENPAWYTAYTPYQPEISQGRLEALLNFQTMLVDLTGLDIASASLLDEATAAAEAMMLAKRSAKNKGNTFFVSAHCHPQTIEVLKTRAKGYGLNVVVACVETTTLPADAFGILLQYPASLGSVVDYRELTAKAHAQQSIVVVATDLLALTVLETPAAIGADIAVGSSQRFGVPFGFGGPHAGFMACSDAYKRNMPGRLVGVSKDAHGKPALRLALQTREQHIRREKATSNICTAQALLAIMASMYAIWHGPEGLKQIGQRVHAYTVVLAKALRQMGWKIEEKAFFDTLTIETAEHTEAVQREAVRQGMNFRWVDTQTVALSLDETVTAADLASIAEVFATVARGFDATVRVEAQPGHAVQWKVYSQQGTIALTPTESVIPSALQRSTPPLAHPIFQSVSSETDMLRYLRRLADKDLALDRTMIPLGSCTMKLNATTEMIPITWPEFAAIHPYAPLDQTQGYQELIQQLSAQLCEITGYDQISLQPNSGAQGEYAGLLAIRGYLDSLGQQQRNVCLIPASAHGTNPASAQMVGMEVVVVACDSDGNVDIADLKRQIEAVGDRLAALMITYPSTHGVFEEEVTEICRLIHAAGGQVYLDGANMNALVGVAQPGKFGSDVSHLNLHKTFSIPHGGGGPGVGPVAVKSHLAPYLPGVLSPQGTLPQSAQTGPVSAAPFGSAGILAIPYAYISLMGGNGLLKATQIAILSANYIAKRLETHYPILYTGKNGRVAHECIIDIRPIKDATGIGAEDIAKRLMDYGFHAPTMSFPVAGTLMVEPTESESLAELDRFIDAMIQIRAEIRAIEQGSMDAENNVLKHAPHTAESLLTQAWDHPYTREDAAYPVPSLRANKYWVPVGRVDNAYGDRNLICSCPPLSEY